MKRERESGREGEEGDRGKRGERLTKYTTMDAQTSRVLLDRKLSQQYFLLLPWLLAASQPYKQYNMMYM